MPAEGEAFALPPLKVMLLLTHGALQKFEHEFHSKTCLIYTMITSTMAVTSSFHGRRHLANASSFGFYATGEGRQEENSKKSKAKMEVVE